jgi:predicted nucleic acid-binding protein
MKCLDTYALMALAQGEAAFAKYMADEFIIPDTTLAEFCWVLMRDFSESAARAWEERLAPYCAPADRDLMLAAMHFRLDNRGKGFSFFDAVGYVFARRHHIPFVTGDESFRDLPGVEFLKAGVRRRAGSAAA